MKKISAKIIYDEAINMWLNIEIIDEEEDIFYIKNKSKKILFKNIDCWLNNSLGVKLATFKRLTYLILDKNWIKVPRSRTIKKWKRIDLDIDFPLVVKPSCGEHWDWVSVNIKSNEELNKAIIRAKKYDKEVIVQEFFRWDDYRLLVINYKFMAAIKRVPAHIIWNWSNSIEELIKIENKNPSRWKEHSSSLTKITIDNEIKKNLRELNIDLNYKPKKNETIFLRKNANLSTGGISIDVTELVNPEIIKMVENAAEILGLKVCWIDYISEDISKPIDKQSWWIIEVNSTPWLRWHHYPSIGKPKNVAKEILKTAIKQL